MLSKAVDKIYQPLEHGSHKETLRDQAIETCLKVQATRDLTYHHVRHTSPEVIRETVNIEQEEYVGHATKKVILAVSV